MSDRKRSPIVLPLVILLLALSLLWCIGWLTKSRPVLGSKEGAGVDSVITYLLITTGIIVFLGHLVLIAFLWKSGQQERAYGRPSRKAEWMWGIIPVLIMSIIAEAGVLVVGGPAWTEIWGSEPENPLALGEFPEGGKASVEVIGKQFEWFIRYPGKDGKFGRIDWEQVHGVDNPIGLDEDDDDAQDDIVKRGTLHLPIDRPVIIRLRTHDVIHSFFVPVFRLKQDLIPGFPTRMKVTPTLAGEFELACAELCGLGHYKMRGTVQVESQEEFDAWLAAQDTFGG